MGRPPGRVRQRGKVRSARGAEISLEARARLRNSGSVNRRGFLRAVGAAGAVLLLARPAAGAPAAADAKLAQAIRERRVVRFAYLDLPRTVAPHVLGVSGGGKRVLLAWQFTGKSRSSEPPGWRTFTVSHIRRLQVSNRTFVARPDFAPQKSRLRAIERTIEDASP